MTAALEQLMIRIDRAVATRLLVFGSIPPQARDLDLLVPDAAMAAVERFLASEGLTRRGRTWARVGGPGTVAVDLFPASAWALPPDEAAALFAEGAPVPGCEHMVVAAAHHRLLILARRVAGGGRFDASKRRAVDGIVGADPNAWASAMARAPQWDAAGAVRLLRRCDDAGAAPSPARRALALVELERGAGRRVPVLRVAYRLLRPRRSAPYVVALSGLDGAGKSTQADLLRQHLEAVGHPTVIEWSRLTFNPGLERIARPVKRLLRRPPVPSALRWRPPDDDLASPEPSPPTLPSQRGPTTAFVWALVVAAANGLTHRRLVRRHRSHHDVVICDRYVLDSAVAIRDEYADGRRRAVHRAIVRALSPPPLRSYLVAVTAEEAYARKPASLTVEELARQAALYEEECTALGVTRLDGRQPADALADRIAREVWLAMGSA